jgi:hypothetical protein
MLSYRLFRRLDFSKGHRGVALLIALGTTLVILIIGSLTIYLITRGLGVTAGQTRYETAYEASVASLEIGKLRAIYLNQNLDAPDTTDIIQVGDYTTEVHTERCASVAVTSGGVAIKFARALAGPGSTVATGSYRTYYIRAKSVGPAGEQVTFEMVERITILAE